MLPTKASLRKLPKASALLLYCLQHPLIFKLELILQPIKKIMIGVDLSKKFLMEGCTILKRPVTASSV